MQYIEKLKNKLKLIDPSFHILRIFSALCMSAVYFILAFKFNFDTISDYASIGMAKVLLIVFAYYVLLTAVAVIIPKLKTDIIIFPVTVSAYFLIMLTRYDSFGFALTLGIAAALAVLVEKLYKHG